MILPQSLSYIYSRTMLNKKEVKDIQSLRHKKFREERNVFVAEGPKIVSELLHAIPQQADQVYATEEWVKNNTSLLHKIPHTVVSDAELEKMSQLQTPHAALAVFRQFNSVPPDATNSFCLYLDTIQDPGNLGTIIRIADWFGVKDVVCSEGCADMYNPKVVQSSMASIARVNIYYDAASNWLPQQEAPVFAAVLDGEPLYSLSKVGAGILLIGNESKGIRPELIKFAGQRVTIPRKGEAESLNAAVATGIILSHLLQ